MVPLVPIAAGRAAAAVAVAVGARFASSKWQNRKQQQRDEAEKKARQSAAEAERQAAAGAAWRKAMALREETYLAVDLRPAAIREEHEVRAYLEERDLDVPFGISYWRRCEMPAPKTTGPGGLQYAIESDGSIRFL